MYFLAISIQIIIRAQKHLFIYQYTNELLVMLCFCHGYLRHNKTKYIRDVIIIC